MIFSPASSSHWNKDHNTSHDPTFFFDDYLRLIPTHNKTKIKPFVETASLAIIQLKLKLNQIKLNFI